MTRLEVWFWRIAEHLLNLIQHITKKPKPGRRTYSSHVIALDKNQLVTMMVVYFSIYPVIQAQEVSPTAESPSIGTAGMCRTIQFHAI